jgi:hypothetical protein
MVDNLGDDLSEPLNHDALNVLEGFFDWGGGVNKQNPEIAYMIRDVFEETGLGGGGGGKGAAAGEE